MAKIKCKELSCEYNQNGECNTRTREIVSYRGVAICYTPTSKKI